VRLALLGLGITTLAFVLSVAVLPTHVTLAAGALRCGTVLHPDRTSEIHALCGKAGAHQLYDAEVGFGGLALIAMLPVLVGRRHPARWRGAIAVVWLGIVLALAATAITWLGWITAYSPPSEIYHL